MKKTTIYLSMCTTMMTSLCMASEQEFPTIPSTPVRLNQLANSGAYDGLSPFSQQVTEQNNRRKIHIENEASRHQLRIQAQLEAAAREQAQEAQAANLRHQQDVANLQQLRVRVREMATQLADFSVQTETLRRQNQTLERERTQLEERKQIVEQQKATIEQDLANMDDSRRRNVALLQQELDRIGQELLEKTVAESNLQIRLAEVERQRVASTERYTRLREESELLAGSLQNPTRTQNTGGQARPQNTGGGYNSDDELGDTSIF